MPDINQCESLEYFENISDSSFDGIKKQSVCNIYDCQSNYNNEFNLNDLHHKPLNLSQKMLKSNDNSKKFIKSINDNSFKLSKTEILLKQQETICYKPITNFGQLNKFTNKNKSYDYAIIESAVKNKS